MRNNHTMNPTCALCNIEMKHKYTGCYISDSPQPHRLTAGDVYECPICGAKIVAGMTKTGVSISSNRFATMKQVIERCQYIAEALTTNEGEEKE